MRPKSLQALREKIRQKTGRTRSGSLRQIMADLNPMLRGWFGYFKHARSSTFQAIDGFVRRRLRAILRRRHKRAGSGRTLKDHQRWPNAFFAAQGLFTLHEAYVQASQSRCGNHRPESRVRENRQHGSEGGEGESPFRPLSI